MTAAPLPRRRRPASRAEVAAAWIMAAPWLAKLLLLTILPLVATVGLSFATLPITGMPQWAGLANYEQMMADPAFARSAQNSLLFALVSVPIKLILALALALLLHRARALAGF